MSREVLKTLIANFNFINIIAECQNAMEAANEMAGNKIDLLLLDIQMPGLSGIDFLKSLATRPATILITSRPEFALEAFEYNVVDYIIKPVKEERFVKAIMRAKEIFDSNSRTINSDKEFFFIREKGVANKVKINDILYIQALGDYINIYTPSKKHTVHLTLNSIAADLPLEKFMRVHRSYIVAIDKIDSLEDGTAYVFQTNIPIADSQRAELMKKLNLL